MFGNGYNENERLQRRFIGICCILFTHALVNFAVGLYRCHDIAPQTTDLLATALPRAQTTLLILWLILGRAPFIWRLCAFVGGHALIFSNFTTWMVPGFYELGIPWSSKDWIRYFELSRPGSWLAKLPFLAIGIAAPLLMYRCAQSLANAWSASRKSPVDKSTSSSLPWINKFRQFSFVDVGIWVLTGCLALNVLLTPGYLSWFPEFHFRWHEHFSVELTELNSSPANWLYIVVPLVVVLLHRVESEKRYKFVLQLLTTVVLGLAFQSQFSWHLSSEISLGVSTMLLISLSLFFLEFVESPPAKIQKAITRELPEMIGLQEDSNPEAPIGNTLTEIPSLEID